jgi:peptide deformylase
MNIISLPDARLRQKCRSVADFNEKLNSVPGRLTELMRINKGCVGIAAPQAGHMERIAVIDASGHKKTTACHGLIILINPEIIKASGSSVNREGCLSVPDFTGNVERCDYIKVKCFDTQGEERIFETSGFEAVVAQHELDHLDGVLFIDKIKDLKRDLFRRKLY